MSKTKDTEFGIIPMHWNFIKASEYCSKVTDGTHDSPKQQTIGRYLITSKHIKGREIDFESAYLISQEDFEKINKRSYVEQWDVIISMIGEYCGFTYVERNERIDYAVENVGIYKTGSELNAFWLHYFLSSTIGKYILDINKNGSSQPYITLGSLRELPILKPPDNEKIAIVAILSSLDDKIDLLHRQNATLEKMAETLFRQWFVEEAKEEWENCKLEDLCIQINSGGTPSTKVDSYYNGNINWYSTKELNDNYLFESIVKITREGLNNSSAKLFPRGTVLIAIYAAPTVGRLGILANEAAFNQAACGLIADNGKCCKEFIYLFLKNQRDELNAMASGSAQQNLNVGKIKAYPAFIPDSIIMNIFKKHVIPLFDKVEKNSNQIRTLTTLRDTLLPKLMNGEIKVDI